MNLDELDDAELVKLARGEVPPHLRAALLEQMHGRVQKYAEGGKVQAPNFDWITPQTAAMLLNRSPGSELPPGITDDILRQIVKKGSAIARPTTAPSAERELSPIQRAQKQRGEEVTPSLRERLPSVERYGDSSPASELPKISPVSSAIAAPASASSAIAAPASKPEEPPGFDPRMQGFRLQAEAPKRPVSASARARPAQPQRQEPNVSPPPMRPADEVPRMEEPDIPPPPMRPTEEKAAPPTWASPLIAAGLAMMASPHRNFGRAVGEAGLVGMRQLQAEEEQRRRMARDERQFSQADRQLDQQAELTREQIAARRQAAEENARLRGDEIVARREDRQAQLGIQGQRLAMDREMMGLEKQKMQAAIAQMGARGDPTKLIYDTAAGFVEKTQGTLNPMSPADAMRAAVELYQGVVNRGPTSQQAAPPLGHIPSGGISQGGQRPNPAGLLP